MAKSAKAATVQANEPQVAAEAKKPAKRAAKKPAAEAPKKTENIYVQYGGKEWDAGELAEKRDGDRGMSLEIQDFSEEELNQLQHYIRYLKFLRKKD